MQTLNLKRILDVRGEDMGKTTKKHEGEQNKKKENKIKKK